MHAPMGELSPRRMVEGIREHRCPVSLDCPSHMIEMEMCEHDMRYIQKINPGATQFVIEMAHQPVEIRARSRAKASVDQHDNGVLSQSEDGKARMKLPTRK